MSDFCCPMQTSFTFLKLPFCCLFILKRKKKGRWNRRFVHGWGVVLLQEGSAYRLHGLPTFPVLCMFVAFCLFPTLLFWEYTDIISSFWKEKIFFLLVLAFLRHLCLPLFSSFHTFHFLPHQGILGTGRNLFSFPA